MRAIALAFFILIAALSSADAQTGADLAAIAGRIEKLLGFAVPAPTPVIVAPDMERGAMARITVASGGDIVAKGRDGTVYRLHFPPDSVFEDIDVMMTPLASMKRGDIVIEGFGVDLQPAGTELLTPAELTIEPAGGMPMLAKGEVFNVFELDGQRGMELARPAIGLAGKIGLLIGHFSGGGTAKTPEYVFTPVPLNEIGWMPPDGEQGGAASLDDRYRQMGERMKADMEHGRLEPRHIFDALRDWWESAVDAMHQHAGETDAEVEARSEKARYNADAAMKAMKAFEDAIAERFDGVVKQLVETQEALNKAAEGSLKEALKAAESGLAEDAEKLIDAFMDTARAERQCQLLPNAGCAGQRPNLEAFQKIFETFEKHFRFDCKKAAKMVQTLLRLTRFVLLNGNTELAEKYGNRFSNYWRTCFQFEVTFETRQKGQHIDLANLVSDSVFDVDMRVVTRVAPVEETGTSDGASLIIRNFDYNLTVHEQYCDFGVNEISASLRKEPRVRLERVEGGYWVYLTLPKIDAFLHYWDVDCTDPFDFHEEDMWDEGVRRALPQHDFQAHMSFYVPWADAEGAQPAVEEFVGHGEWEENSMRNAVSQTVKVTVRRLNSQ